MPPASMRFDGQIDAGRMHALADGVVEIRRSISPNVLQPVPAFDVPLVEPPPQATMWVAIPNGLGMLQVEPPEQLPTPACAGA